MRFLIKSKTNPNIVKYPNEALTRVKEQIADETGVDFDELTFDFQIDEPEPFASGGGVGSLFPPENGIGSMFRGV